MVTDNILDLIGNTPLLKLKNERIYAKAEFLNPGGMNLRNDGKERTRFLLAR